MRLDTLAKRTAAREAEFAYLLKNGYQQQTYKGLDFFTKDGGKYFTLKVFKGTAANHIEYINYRTAESRTAKIEQYKQGYDRQTAWKAEQKEKNKGKSSSHAATAAAIKKELQSNFSGVKFSVKSDSFSGGNSVHIEWTDGPTEAQVKEFSSKYEYGHFNGMEDIYEYSNRRDDIPQVKYVQERREMSEEIKALAEVLKNRMHPDSFKDTDWHNSPEQIIYRLFYNTAIPAGAKITGLERTEITCGSMEEFYKITFEAPEQKTETATEQQTAGKIQIVDYSEKAFAVIGEFSAYYDDLLSLGGKYNKFLKCGRGIIFSKTRIEAVKEYLIKAKSTEQPEEPKQLQAPEIIEEEQQQENTADLLPPVIVNLKAENELLPLEYFTIIWHEGRHIEGATFANAKFDTWAAVQQVFYILWYVNERGQKGGYTKVKCEIKLQGQDSMTDRIDITAQDNADFNPSLQHISDYLRDLLEYDETTPEHEQMRQHLLY